MIIDEAADHILIVEDDRINSKLLEMILEGQGVSSDVAPSGRDALDLLLEKSYTCVLMDLELPDIDGIELTKKIKNGEAGPAAAEVPVYCVSANAKTEKINKGCHEVFDGFIQKPVNLDKISELISELKA